MVIRLVNVLEESRRLQIFLDFEPLCRHVDVFKPYFTVKTTSIQCSVFECHHDGRDWRTKLNSVPLEPEVSVSKEITKGIDTSGSKGTQWLNHGIACTSSYPSRKTRERHRRRGFKYAGE